MLAAINTSLAAKVAVAIGASVAIGATAVAGPEVLPFIDGDAAVTNDGTDANLDAEVQIPEVDGEVSTNLDAGGATVQLDGVLGTR